MTDFESESDEALALRLQFEEEARASAPRPGTAVSVKLSAQERNDMALAQEYARMDRGGGGSGSQSLGGGGGDGGSGGGGGGGGGGGFQGGSVHTTNGGQAQNRSSSAAHFARASAHSTAESLDIARSLQAQAFEDIRRRNSQMSIPAIADEELLSGEFADLEFALRIQEEEARGLTEPSDGSEPQTEDDALAQIMAITQKSLREFSQEELNDLMKELRKPGEPQPAASEQPLSPARRSDFIQQSRSQSMLQIRDSNTPPMARNERPMRGLETRRSTTSLLTRTSTPEPEPRPRITTATRAAKSAPNSPLGDPFQSADGILLDVPTRTRRKPGLRGLFRLGDRKAPPERQPPPAPSTDVPDTCIPAGIPAGIPAAFPGLPAGIPPPPSSAGWRSPSGTYRPEIPASIPAPTGGRFMPPPHSVCEYCGMTGGTFIRAKDLKYHPDCFRCAKCDDKIDANSVFYFGTNSEGKRVPYHAACYQPAKGADCIVCRNPIPKGADGVVHFMRHPFFEKELMCPRHSEEDLRRCSGCHRFEPYDEPFADLNDAGRCVCYACCRTVIVDSNEMQPLWYQVLTFFEDKMGLPLWDGMREIPVVALGDEALNEQMVKAGKTYGNSAQIMSRGLCLMDQDSCKQLKLPAMKFNGISSSFEALDANADGFTMYDVPDLQNEKQVYAIACLSGLPRDLTASILAHEATHAWIFMHPEFDRTSETDPVVVEGCSQLVAMLFLNEGLGPAPAPLPNETPPSDQRLRQYFRYCIESDDSEIYGTGYRQAANLYRQIGVQGLLMHVARFGSFPEI